MISRKTPAEVEIIAEGGRRLALIMKELGKAIKPGIATKELDRLAESLVFKFGGQCSFKGYGGGNEKPFPSCLCVSLNEEVVHGVPSQRKIKAGDLLSLDLGIFYQGFHTDMAKTWPIGEVSDLAKNLISAAEKALWLAIEAIKPGRRFGDLSFIIQHYAESQGFNVVRELCGHGIGRELHEEPEVLNYGQKGTGPELVEGMVFCLEPMFTIGNWRVKKGNNFSYKTIDKSLSAHFEHTVAVTKNGARVLTVL